MKQLLYSLIIVSLPLRYLTLTSPFGYRKHPVTGIECIHAGVDLRANYDTVFAVISSHVSAIGYNPALGLFIKITNGPFCITYGHLSECFVGKGDSVAVACPLGVSGATGRVTGPHLHFALQFHRRYIDPLAFLSAAYQQISKP